MPSILIVDDEANILRSLEGALGREGYTVEGASNVAEARARLREAVDIVLLDVWLPDGSGVDLLAEIMKNDLAGAVIMMSGHATVDLAVQATRLGAYDFLEKPISLDRLLILLRNATESRALEAENRRLRRAWPVAIIGRSAAVERLLGEVERAGPSSARVLIQGEHGTGKELVARALHASSPRHAMSFIAVNCSAIPDELIESELFGHEKGAFTGATQARHGLFEDAHRGTLFLDEVGDLSPRAQTKLLRVLQEGELTRVGGNRAIRVDVRVIAATNRDLAARIKAEEFREDLYFRLAVIPITVPPLRERLADVPLLIEHFAAELAKEQGGRPRKFSADAVALLGGYEFPGNVRELRNLIERLVIMTPGPIGADAIRSVLPSIGGSSSGGGRLSDAVRDFEKQQIEAALAAAGGNVTQAAAQLGLERSHLYKKIKKLGWKADQ
ncbi:MAG TPA: sigma-54 dependent transcriptional regulator [Candidatus Udaeobacter sp.]|nr:sigma-54 dependent transcriptional regulator [Candidatus Udaeobacter sp.]